MIVKKHRKNESDYQQWLNQYLEYPLTILFNKRIEKTPLNTRSLSCYLKIQKEKTINEVPKLGMMD